MNRSILWMIPAVLSFACGPQVKEQRIKNASARDSNCVMDVVHSSPADFSGETRYEHLGNITLADAELPDPYAPQNLGKARERACAMGANVIMVLREEKPRLPKPAAIRYAAMRDRATETRDDTQPSL